MSIICPECGEINEAGAIECKNCYEPLVAIETGFTAGDGPDGDGDSTADTADDDALVSSCHASALSLFEIKKRVTIDIVTAVNIGRENSEVMPEFFSTDRYLSALHCGIYPDGEKWMIEDYRSTNKTFVNNIRVVPGMSVAIKDGDLIKMADLIFKVKIVKVEPDISDTDDTDTNNDSNGGAAETPAKHWVIQCPVCGHRYPVDDENAHISICKFCDDEVDREEIDFIKPKLV